MSQHHESKEGTDDGVPIGMPEYRDGRIVQDFEGGRFTVAEDWAVLGDVPYVSPFRRFG